MKKIISVIILSLLSVNIFAAGWDLINNTQSSIYIKYTFITKDGAAERPSSFFLDPRQGPSGIGLSSQEYSSVQVNKLLMHDIGKGVSTTLNCPGLELNKSYNDHINITVNADGTCIAAAV